MEHTEMGSSYEQKLPALIDTAKRQLEEWGGGKAHVLRSTSLLPPIGHYPHFVYTTIDPDPKNGQVYEDEQKKLSLTAKGLEKIAGMLGYDVDYEHSGRIDDGSNPNIVRWRTVLIATNEIGEKRNMVGTYELDLNDVVEEIKAKLRDRVEYAKRVIGKKDEEKLSKDLFYAVKGGKENEWMRAKAEKEYLRIRRHKTRRAETGSFTAAIRSSGMPTSFTKEELAKPFVDIRMLQFPGFFQGNGAQAQHANSSLYGTARPEKVEPKETVIEANATAWEEGKQAEEVMQEQPTGKPTERENLLADFDACEVDQQIKVVMEVAKRNKWPMALRADEMKSWKPEVLRSIFTMILDFPAHQ